MLIICGIFGIAKVKNMCAIPLHSHVDSLWTTILTFLGDVNTAFV